MEDILEDKEVVHIKMIMNNVFLIDIRSTMPPAILLTPHSEANNCWLK
jgi:hypothetical protein